MLAFDRLSLLIYSSKGITKLETLAKGQHWESFSKVVNHWTGLAPRCALGEESILAIADAQEADDPQESNAGEGGDREYGQRLERCPQAAIVCSMRERPRAGRTFPPPHPRSPSAAQLRRTCRHRCKSPDHLSPRGASH